MEISDIYNYYNARIEENELIVKQTNRKIYTLGTIRLLLVLSAIITLILWTDMDWIVVGLIILSYLIPFLFFIVWDGKLSSKKDYAKTLITLCKNEIAALNYDFSAFDGATMKISSEHSFSLDLDLFGEKSLFQSLNRTVTIEGKERLCNWFLDPLTNKKEIIRRQNAIQELSLKNHLRQDFYVTGTVRRKKDSEVSLLKYLIGTPPKFIKNKIWEFLSWLIPSVWLLLILLYLIVPVSPIIAFAIFIFSAIIAFSKTKDVNKLHSDVDKMDKILSVYSELISIIENNSFNSDFLIDIKKHIEIKGMKVSKAIKELSKQMHTLDQRGNIFAIILNVMTLREIRAAVNIEKWKAAHKDHIEGWFNALGDFDALLSLGGFAFNHPNYIYPTIKEKYFEIKGTALGHPLLHRDTCVHNDISISESPQFLIITGANMAGKSTYLRTIGVNFLLACVGSPVCAKELSIYPALLVTSLRTSDSLIANESYFYAELKKLKKIIDRLNNNEKLFIILDEILKGTNSEDKQKGSLALIRQFISYQTCGIIATHDLVLGTLKNELPEYISNYRFEADIEKDKLTFSYKLKEGIAKNLNAYFLMKKMGITV